MTGARIALPRPWRARHSSARAHPRRGLPRPRRRAVVLAALAALLLVAGWYWGRDLALWSVNDVRITGATGQDAPQIRAALRRAARAMTTLHVRAGDLRDAVTRFPVVKALRVHTDFPHGLRIEVVENVPVAALSAGGRQVAVATDGTILRDRPLTGLPLVPAQVMPSGDRVSDAQAQGAIALAGAAPASVRPLIVRVRSGGHDGLRVDLQGGVRLVFGSRARLHAKWAAALAVMSDARAAGATYLDLRIPDRPVAGAFGMPPPSATPGHGGTAAADTTAGGAAANAAATDPQGPNPAISGGEPPT
jgi:cell division protein FtsQ